MYVTVEQLAQPFTQSPMLGAATSSAPSAALTHLCFRSVFLPFGFVALWRYSPSGVCAGAESLLSQNRLCRLRKDARSKLTWSEDAGLATPIEIRLSRSTLEPGIFGITTPILVWPEGISERLDDAQLQAVIAHELWHVRRRDNLAAAFHMLVEAIFWFHPLVWWLGTRLVEERERACDEEVLEFGSERQIYAESILKVCEFCVGSPLPCVSGVTGADLKQRMVHIMSEHVVRNWISLAESY